MLTPRSSLTRNIGLAVFTQGGNIAVGLIATPVMLSGVGLAGFGVWTVALATASYVTTFGGGIGAGMQRFVAVAATGDQAERAERVVWTGLAIFVALGACVALLAQVAAPVLVSVFRVDRAMEHDAQVMWRIMGASIGLALVASFLGNVQQGLDRFSRFAVDQSISLVVFLSAIVVAVEMGKGLPGLATASLTYHVSLTVLRLWSLRDVIHPLRPKFEAFRFVRELMRFMGIFQITVTGNLINLQSDRIIAGLIAAPTVVGQLGIASQIAVALRLVAGSAISPILTRLSAIHGRGIPRRLLTEFRRINRVWVLSTAGCAAIMIIALSPLVASWVGPGHGQAAAFGAVLVFAYAVNLLTAPGTSLLIAMGRPQIEAKYTTITVVLNIAGTVALGLLFGVMGVVAATGAAYVAGTAWFLLQLRRYADWVPQDPVRLTARVVVCSLLSGAVAFAWCWLVKETLPPGIAVVPAGLGVCGCLLLYLRLIGVARDLLVPRQAIDVKGP